MKNESVFLSSVTQQMKNEANTKWNSFTHGLKYKINTNFLFCCINPETQRQKFLISHFVNTCCFHTLSDFPADSSRFVRIPLIGSLLTTGTKLNMAGRTELRTKPFSYKAKEIIILLDSIRKSFKDMCAVNIDENVF